MAQKSQAGGESAAALHEIALQAQKQNGGNGGNGGPPPPPPPPPSPSPFIPAYYIFRLDSFTITNTRAWDEDTDHATVGLQVGGQTFEPQTRHMGDVDNGTHQVGLQFGPVLVEAPTTPIAFNYQILNNGHANDADIEKNLSAGAIALLARVFSLSTPWTAILGVVINYLFGFLWADCDGPVAVDQINLTGATLWAWTHGVGTHTETKYYPGTESPDGCGGNSEYYVTSSIVGAGIVPVGVINVLQTSTV